MRRLTQILVGVLMIAGASSAQRVRIAEITDIEGVRENIVRGIGLVVGLAKTGDKSDLARRMMANVVRRSEVNVTEDEMATGNAAVVMVTAKIDPFRRPGSRIDVTVSSLQDAKSLFGGTLLETHLVGFDRKTVYAIAEGAVVVGGIGAEGESGSSVAINHTTVGSVPNGALMENSIPMVITDRRGIITLMLKNQDWTTADRIQEAINGVKPGVARAVNAGAVEVLVPVRESTSVTGFIAELQALPVDVHTVSKIVIDEKTGVIVAGQDVRITTAAVTVGKLSVTIQETPQPVVGEPFTNGPGIASVPRSEVAITEEQAGLRVVEGGESIARLSQSLNALGASPRQLIAILQAIKTAGGLQAELIVR